MSGIQSIDGLVSRRLTGKALAKRADNSHAHLDLPIVLMEPVLAHKVCVVALPHQNRLTNMVVIPDKSKISSESICTKFIQEF